MTSEKEISPESIYKQAEDKQRIVITGNEAKTITLMITHTLREVGKDFDFVVNGESHDNQPINKTTAAILIIEASEKPFTGIAGYHHHIGVISDIDDQKDVVQNISSFADATPKAGLLIFRKSGTAGTIGDKARADVTLVPYTTYVSKNENGKLVLISSTDERFPIKFTGEQNLQSLSAAKEVVKKLGITSGQFYKAMTSIDLKI